MKRKYHGSSDENKASVRQQKLARISDPGADDNPRGFVRGSGTSLMWYDSEARKWLPALHHNTIRRTLLDRASQNGLQTYSQPRRRGNGPDDETAFHEEQRHWVGQRSQWALIRDDVLNRFERVDTLGQAYVGRDNDLVPRRWHEDGRIVLGMSFPRILVCSKALKEHFRIKIDKVC